MDDSSARPESFVRRLLWKNSGILCLATLITLPIIIGVAIGYIIVLAVVTSYKKITGKKSREEKENEAAKKIRIVLGHELLDSAFTKPVQLPGQQPRRVMQVPRYGAANQDSNVTLSSDGIESDEVTETDEEFKDNPEEERKETIEVEDEIKEREGIKERDEIMERDEIKEREGIKERGEIKEKSEIKGENEIGNVQECNDTSSGKVENGVKPNDSYADRDVSRATSASSEYYSTASEMEEPRKTDPREGDKPAQRTQDSCGTPARTLSEVPELPAKPVIQDSAAKLPEKPVPAIPKNSLHLDSQVKLCGPSPALGKLKYSIQYMKDRNQLQVTILKAINLLHHPHESHPSSYVKVSLLPQRFCWQRTKVIEATRNPVYNETFVISGFSHERFGAYTLLICVVNALAQWKGYYGDHVIGEVYVPLSHVAKYANDDEKAMCEWSELKPKMAAIQDHSKCGKINLALCYRPISGRLIVTIKKAKELKCESKEKLDPYVKLALYCDGTRVGRGATRVKRKITNPVFNEKFNFDLTSDQIAYTTIVVKMINNIDSSSSCLGATVIGYESATNGQEHWLCMMECLSQHVDAWHNIYD